MIGFCFKLKVLSESSMSWKKFSGLMSVLVPMLLFLGAVKTASSESECSKYSSQDSEDFW